MLAVEAHRLLRGLCPVVLVPLLHLLDLGLELAHCLHLLALLEGKRNHGHADDDGEGDDRQPEVVEEDVVEQDEAVDHRPHDDGVPYVAEYVHSWDAEAAYRPLAARKAAKSAVRQL